MLLVCYKMFLQMLVSFSITYAWIDSSNILSLDLFGVKCCDSGRIEITALILENSPHFKPFYMLFLVSNST